MKRIQKYSQTTQLVSFQQEKKIKGSIFQRVSCMQPLSHFLVYIYEIKYIKDELMFGGLQIVKQQDQVEKAFCSSKRVFNPQFCKWVYVNGVLGGKNGKRQKEHLNNSTEYIEQHPAQKIFISTLKCKENHKNPVIEVSENSQKEHEVFVKNKKSHISYIPFLEIFMFQQLGINIKIVSKLQMVQAESFYIYTAQQ